MRTRLIYTVVVVAVAAALFALGVLVMKNPGLKDFSDSVQRQTLPPKKPIISKEIKPTALPFTVPGYLSDFTLGPEDLKNIDLKEFIPDGATESAGLLSLSTYQFKVKTGARTSRLDVKLSTGTGSDSGIKAVLFDAMLRPVRAWNGTDGQVDDSINITDGIYRIELTAPGLLSPDYAFSLALRDIDTGDKEHNVDTGTVVQIESDTVNGDEETIPTLKLQFTPSAMTGWNFLLSVARQKIEEAGGQGQVAKGLPNKAVLGAIRHEGAGLSSVGLTLSGAGYGGHFDETSPSFTVKTHSGPLYRGMSTFKLYSIKVKEGLLDYVTGSMLRDEGLFVPRWLLVNLEINGDSRGVYVLEEIPSPEFFAGVKEYDGRITARSVKTGKNKTFYKPSAPDGFPPYTKLPPDFDLTPTLFDRLARERFAKTIAYITRFQATHATQKSDFRFYQHPYLYSFTPIIRDMNVDFFPSQALGYRGFLTHTSWWYGKRVFGGGPHFNPREYPMEAPHTSYTITDNSLTFASVHPSLNNFVRETEQRELFEKYLFWASDDKTLKRWQRRMSNTYEATKEYLGNYAPFIVKQVTGTQTETMRVPAYLPLLESKSRLLLFTDTATKSTESGSTEVTLYNLSPFTARVRLPGYATVVGDSSGTDSNGALLAPSDLFALVTPESSMRTAKSDASGPKLTRFAARSLLEIERARVATSSGKMRSIPYITVTLPKGSVSSFIAELNNESSATLHGSSTRLRVLPVTGLSDREDAITEPPKPKLDIDSFFQKESAPEPKTDNIYNFNGKSFIETGHSIDEWTEFSATTLLKLTSAPEPGQYEIIFDLNHSRDINGVLQLGSTENPEEAELAWYIGGRAIIRHISVGKWHHIAVTADKASKSIILFVDNVKVAETVTPNPPWSERAQITIGRKSGIEARFLNASIKGLAFYDSVLTHESIAREWLDSGLEEATRSTVTVLPIDHFAIDDGFRLNYLVANLSNSRTELNITELLPTSREGVALKVTAARALVPSSGDERARWKTGSVTLGAGSKSSTASTGLWVGALNRFVKYRPADTKDPSVALVQLDVVNPRTSAISYHNIPGADFALTLKEKSPLPVTVHEPYILLLPPTVDKISPLLPQELRAAAPVTNSPELQSAGVTKTGEQRVMFKPNTQAIESVITVAEDSVLTLKSGTTISFGESGGLLIYGTLEATGTEESPVELVPVDSELGWLGVAIVGAKRVSRVEHVEMSGARGGRFGNHWFSGAFSAFETEVAIKDSSFSDLRSNDGLHFFRSFYSIEGSSLNDTKDDGLDTDWGYGVITGSAFSRSGGDAVDFSGSYFTLSDNSHTKAKDKGVSSGEGSVLEISKSRFSENRIGLAVKDQSVVVLDGNDFTKNKTAIAQYRKKPGYGFPALILKENSFIENGRDRVTAPDSVSTNRFD
ncbi:MAG: right-handed parallel beta-helix repeat-containing protein [Proteobacteria bacterium]|nr:right-handed parallel beta-helix repeat-containing protein [Pseudomonadota bacterium]